MDSPIIQFFMTYGFEILLYGYLGMIAVERMICFAMRRGAYDNANALGSMATSTLVAVSHALLATVIPYLTYVWVYQNFALFDPGFVWWAWIVAFWIHEAGYFFDHWATHRIGALWAFHQPHHSSEHLNFTTAARGTVFGAPLQVTFFMTAALIGIHPAIFAVVAIAKNFYGIFNHTELIDKMGPFENWLATPANHRVHHGRNPLYIDKNYGQVTVVFDRIFRTFQRETEKPDYGLVEPMVSNNPLRIMTSGFTWLGKRIGSAPTWADKLRYLYKPPEWTHDGSKQGCAAARVMPAE